MPIAWAAYLGKVLTDGENDPARRRRVALLATAMAAGIVAAVGVSTMRRPVMNGYRAEQPREADWPRFLAGYGRFASGATFFAYRPVVVPDPPLPRGVVRAHDLAFWGMAAAAVGLGLPGLIRRRDWARLAVPAGLAVGLAGFHLAAGPAVLWGQSWRYGGFAIVPTAVAFACLLVSENGPRTRRSAAGPLLIYAACFAMLAGTKLHYFDYFTSAGHESLWTLRTDAKDPHRRIVATILRDAGRARRPVVVGADWWAAEPLEYLSRGGSSLDVRTFEGIGPHPDPDPVRLRAVLEAGGYAVSLPGTALERSLLALYPADRLQRRDFPNATGDRYLSLYQVIRPRAEATATVETRAEFVTR